jgi:hypothetical protein
MQALDITPEWLTDATAFLACQSDEPSRWPCSAKNPVLFDIYCRRTGLDPDNPSARLTSEAEVTIFLDWSLFPVQGTE